MDSEIKVSKDAELLREIRNSFYMDDFPIGAQKVSEAKSAVKSVIEVFRKGHFLLDKFATNSKEQADFLEKVGGSEVAVSSSNKSGKFLGIGWNQVSDSLFVGVDDTISFLSSGPASKRRLLQGLARVFDPLGIIAPIAIKMKMLLQVLWTEKLDWDDPLPEALEAKYREATEALKFGNLIRIDRSMFGLPREKAIREIHVFGDASLSGFGAVAYLREFPKVNPDNKASVKFIMARARVCPLRGRWSIPRLELVAALIAARLAKTIRGHLASEID